MYKLKNFLGFCLYTRELWHLRRQYSNYMKKEERYSTIRRITLVLLLLYIHASSFTLLALHYKNNNVTKILFIFFFISFLCGKGYVLLQNIVWENVVYTITFLLFFLVFHDIWNKVTNTNVLKDLHWSCRRRTLTPNTWH